MIEFRSFYWYAKENRQVNALAIRSKLGQVFSGHVETRDKHEDQRLQTHYYKTSKDKLMQELISIFKHMKHCEVVAESQERGEISVNIQGRKMYYLVATVIMVRPFRTAVDFSVTAKSGMDFGFGRKTIENLHEKLASIFEYIGTGKG